MKYVSTGDPGHLVDFLEGLHRGLAPERSLYVPESLPHWSWQDFRSSSYIEAAIRILEPFVSGSLSRQELSGICERAFDFPVPIETLSSELSCLELFHGPTNAFKDFGARFLAECLSLTGNSKETWILVATSGDTGAAVASAFYERPGFRVALLFPKGMVSPRQEHQLTCWGGNIHSFEVDGDFDDCQRMVKEALPKLTERGMSLTSANSINIGRLLPQMIYYYFASVQMAERGKEFSVVVPTGNLGNGVAALMAKKMGAPIIKLGLALNANRALADYYQSGEFQAQPTVATLANAMDVGNASNFERLNHFMSWSEIRESLVVESVSDSEIKEFIGRIYSDYQYLVCPHTATGFALAARHGSLGPWLVAGTAHPAKFNEVIQPILGLDPEVPPELKGLLERPLCKESIQNKTEKLVSAILDL